jgi:IS30 family transposase
MSYEPHDKSWTYVHPEGVKTQNEQLSDNLRETVRSWIKNDHFKKWDKDLSEVPLQTFVRYVAMAQGKPMARKGGLLITNNKEKKFMTLKNVMNGRAWSLQYINLQKKSNKLLGIYYANLPKAHLHKEAIAQKEVEQKVDVKKELNKIFYDQGNFVSRDKLYEMVKREDLPITRKEVEVFLNDQTLHQLTKRVPKSVGLKGIQSNGSFNIMEMDLIEYNKKFIITCIDVFSRTAFARMLKNKEKGTVLSALKKIMKSVQVLNKKQYPKSILSDNGSEFKNDQMSAWLEKKGIKQIFGIPAAPTGQAFIERFNGTLKQLLNKTTLNSGEQLNKTILQNVLNSYNNLVHDTTTVTPIEGLQPQHKETIMKSFKQLEPVGTPKDDLKIGDKVRLSIEKSKVDKSAIKWTEELFTVSKVTRNNNPLIPIKYKVKGKNDEELKGYLPREQLQKITNTEGHNPAVFYEINRILKKRKLRGKLQYLVSWKGYTQAEATWQDAAQLKLEVPDKVAEFENKKKKQNE